MKITKNGLIKAIGILLIILLAFPVIAIPIIFHFIPY